MDHFVGNTLNPKKAFKEKGTCSHTFAFLLNNEFNNSQDAYEKALDPLAGGIMRKGHQCGMLWGAVLAIGTESFKLQKDTHSAAVLSLMTAKKLMASFKNETGTVNCREFTGCNMDNFFGLTKYMVKVTLQGMENSPCFNLAEDWAPTAIQVAKKSLADETGTPDDSTNCASEVVRKMGASDAETAMVAGFAGGMGLSGHGCGALAAAIWYKSLGWLKDNPDKSAYSNPLAKSTLKRFQKATNNKFVCTEICNSQFKSIEEHSSFIKNGGCKEIMDVLSQ